MYWEYYFTIENVLVTCHIFVSILSIIRERYKNVAELIINILSFSKGGILDKFTKIIERYWLFLRKVHYSYSTLFINPIKEFYY